MAAAVTSLRMPWKSHHSAPKFDGEPARLDYFFEEVEQLAQLCNLSGAEKIQWTVRYAPVIDFELWKHFARIKSDNWTEFKAEIYHLYPGSAASTRYTIRNLKKLCQDTGSALMESNMQYGIYYRAFLTVSRFLEENGCLSAREISAHFFRGFDHGFRRKVADQLRAENPTHHSDDPYPLSTIDSAARFILSCGLGNTSPGEQLIEAINNITAPVKQEPHSIAELPAHITGDQSFMSKIAQKIIQTISESQPEQNSVPNFENNRSRSCRCIFCSSPSHYLSACPEAQVMIQNGMCQLTNEGRIILPNGRSLEPRSASGRDLKEQIEAWHKRESSSSVIVQSTSLEPEHAHTIGYNESSNLPFTNVQSPIIEVKQAAITKTGIEQTRNSATARVDNLYRSSDPGHQEQRSPRSSMKFEVTSAQTKSAARSSDLNASVYSRCAQNRSHIADPCTVPAELKHSQFLYPLTRHAQSFDYSNGNNRTANQSIHPRDAGSHHRKVYTWLAEEPQSTTSA